MQEARRRKWGGGGGRGEWRAKKTDSAVSPYCQSSVLSRDKSEESSSVWYAAAKLAVAPLER